ncbi:PREDICTED: mitogen-activated protein kinase kinase kinase 1-like [Camelina sativa]|uniref:Mitogen-activated protein kinase kinase kinase 1-like n=1 Tax=Camelina sativa TaxID=90675 RepID=A0ABM0ZAV8_CAMSA|nr:PREDICTED: mitogen-activated protein kinase kinase kinase 1-like [Camelina sativa]
MQKKVIGDVTEESSLKIVSVIDKDTYGYGSVSKNNNDSNLEKSYMKKSCTLKHAEKLERELKTMLHFRANPFIVQASCPHLHFEYNTKSATLCYIYMEYASLGNLDKMISDAGGKLPEDSVRRATRMILQGLKALHAEGYLHCDLKPSNVFVFPSSRPGEPWDLKLTGFGLSKDPTMDSMLLFPGTREYMPPEATMPNMFSGMDRLIGPSRDIWSLGHTVLRMLGGILEEMGHSIAWTTGFYISPVATDFYMWCCKLRPTERPTIDELLDHPFVAERPSSFHEVSIFSKEQSYFRRHDELIPQHPIPDPLGTFNRFVNRSLHYPATR